MDKLRIGLVDDHPMFRTAIQFLLNPEEYDIVFSEDTFSSCIAKYQELQSQNVFIDILLADFFVKDESFFQFITQLRKINSLQKIVLLTSAAEREVLQIAYDCQIDGMLIKSASIDELELCFNKILKERESFFSNELQPIMNEIMNETNPKELNNAIRNYEKLSKRELEIIFYIELGLMSKEIASELNISKKTVDIHRENILRKFETQNILTVIRDFNRVKNFKKYKGT